MNDEELFNTYLEDPVRFNNGCGYFKSSFSFPAYGRIRRKKCYNMFKYFPMRASGLGNFMYGFTL